MSVSPAAEWKLVLAVALVSMIVFSAAARAPKLALPGRDLHRLVFSALFLYVVGGLAWLTHHLQLAVMVYAAGIATAALAAWLSRGVNGEDPPDFDDPAEEGPPPDDPDSDPRFDWDAFEREFKLYSERTDRRVGAR